MKMLSAVSYQRLANEKAISRQLQPSVISLQASGCRQKSTVEGLRSGGEGPNIMAEADGWELGAHVT
jgi:hypothetical protein